MQRFNSDPTVADALNKFVWLEVSVDSAEGKAFMAKYPPPGNGLPMVYTIASNGQEVDKIAGAPAGASLNRFLETTAANAAAVVPPRTDNRGEEPNRGEPRPESPAVRHARERRFATLVRRAEGHFERDNYAGAVAVVSPLLTEQADLAKGSDDLAKLVSELELKGREAIDLVAERSASDNQLLLAFVAQVAAERNFGRLPSLSTDIETAAQKLAAKPRANELRRQAEAIDVARAAEERRDLKGAIAGYLAVIRQFPETMAAKMAKARGQQLYRVSQRGAEER